MGLERANSYSCAVFPTDDDIEYFQNFAELLKPGDSAPDVELLDLDSGETIRLRDVTQRGLTVIELGSFT